jgi:hypothetical protein
MSQPYTPAHLTPVSLQTMDWSIPVHVWMVELDGTNPQKDSDVRALLGSRGYLPLPRDIPFTNKYLNEVCILMASP